MPKISEQHARRGKRRRDVRAYAPGQELPARLKTLDKKVVVCPDCKADAGTKCVSTTTGKTMGTAHTSRQRMALRWWKEHPEELPPRDSKAADPEVALIIKCPVCDVEVGVPCFSLLHPDQPPLEGWAHEERTKKARIRVSRIPKKS